MSDVVLYPPGKLSREELIACVSIIAAGGAVERKWVAAELPLAMMVAVKTFRHDIVGVGVIKRRRPDYAADKARRSGFLFDPNIHELGYVAVKETHQGLGISKEIAATLLAAFQERPLFATTASDRMKKTLERAGFVKSGGEWPARKGGQLSLWIKD